jgi:hypothetical protein
VNKNIENLDLSKGSYQKSVLEVYNVIGYRYFSTKFYSIILNKYSLIFKI